MDKIITKKANGDITKSSTKNSLSTMEIEIISIKEGFKNSKPINGIRINSLKIIIDLI